MRGVVLIAILLGAGCGRVGFSVLGPLGDAGIDGGMDAAADGGIDPPGDGETHVDAGPPDAGPDAPVEPCEEMPCRLVLPQCGCPDGLACQRTMAGTAVRECVPPGDHMPGEPCEQSIECVTGYTCLRFAGFPGICSRYCYGDAECEGPGARCVQFVAPSEGVGVCSHPCNPVEDIGCTETHGCHIARTTDIDGATVVTTGCFNPAGPAPGEACTALCAAGATCVGGMCFRVCVVGGAAICGVGATCQSTAPTTVIGKTEYGICVPGSG